MGFSFFKSKSSEKQKVDPEIVAGLNGERSSNPQVSIKLAEHFLRENKRELAVDEYLNAAQSFLEKRQMQLAMAVYRNIITIDPERYSVYETLADLYLKSGFPGDCASVLLALAYQYKTAGCDSEVKRVLDSVLEVAPNNPVLKRKVQAFFAAEGCSEAPAKPAAASVQTSVPVQPPELAPASEVFAQSAAPVKPAAAPVQTSVPVQPPEPAPAPEISAQSDVPEEPIEPDATGQPLFDLQAALATDAAPVQASVPVQPSEPSPEPEIFAQSDVPEEPIEPDATGQPLFDLQSALATDAAPVQTSVPVEPPEPSPEPEVFAQPSASAKPEAFDATARSFFDLQSALATDASLGFDYDSTSEGLLDSNQEGSLFSVLNVVKDIAEQDPRQDTPLFHFNLGTAYMECGDYEQAVDEFLSALYGTSDKIGCYVCLAECSLKLQRRELACGFLREALDNPDISPEQDRNVRKLLDEISAS